METHQSNVAFHTWSIAELKSLTRAGFVLKGEASAMLVLELSLFQTHHMKIYFIETLYEITKIEKNDYLPFKFPLHISFQAEKPQILWKWSLNVEVIKVFLHL